MSTLKVSFRKLGDLEFECYENAIRLHLDSVLLLRARSFPSAFALSVIASEEFGKGFAIEEIIYQARFQKGFNDRDKEYLRALLSNHKLKQRWFVNHAFDSPRSKRLIKKYQSIQNDKNNALYVGLRRGNHHIVGPFSVSKSKALDQVQTINDALIRLMEGTLSGDFGFEEVFDHVLRQRRILKKLKMAAVALKSMHDKPART